MRKNKQIVGIIAEYNPFHNGHAYHIKQAKKLARADYCVAVMSGDFVQRGAPAIFDKYTRTVMALSCGADLVLELPSIFASSSAEDFAACGIALLDHLGAIDSVCFGSECGDIKKLSAVASILAMEPPVYTEQLRMELKKGSTFPAARNKALISSGILSEEDAALLASPNNILGIEYLKALSRHKSSIIPITITRKGSSYHDPQLAPGSLGSATGIRKTLKENPDIRNLSHSPLSHVPDSVKPMIEKGFPLFSDDFSTLLHTALLRLAHEGIPFQNYADVSEELAARITRQLPDFLSFSEMINTLKTRQYTYTRISRALLHIALGITKDQVIAGKENGYAPYARVLGFRKHSAGLMGEIKKNGRIPLITKTADARSFIPHASYSMLEKDFYCSHIYQTIVQDKYSIQTKNEFTHSVIIL